MVGNITKKLNITTYNINDLINKDHDMNRQYSFQGNDAMFEKHKDNMALVLPRLIEITKKYQIIINEDKILLKAIEDLTLFLQTWQTLEQSNYHDIYEYTEQLFNKIIDLTALDQDELARIDNEAMLSIDEENKKEQYLQLKVILEDLQSKYLVIYADS